LLFFILENVKGFCHKQSNGEVPLTTVLQFLRENLPGDWVTDHRVYNTKDFGLPHHRERVYLTGRKTAPSSHVQCYPRPVSSWKSKAIGFKDIAKPLGSSAAGHLGRGYSQLQRGNLRSWKVALSSELRQKSLKGEFIFVAYDRTPSDRTLWCPKMDFEACECLTANGPALHCFSLGDHGKSRNSTILASERGALQGFPVGYIEDDEWSAVASKAVGNAMSVPVVAAVCFRELFHQLQLRPFVICMPTLSPLRTCLR